jgi:hypothetical protein
MQDISEALGKNFERLLRWVYPGALFLVLLRMSRPEAFDAVAHDEPVNVWGLVVVGLVAGFVVYLIQSYVVNYFVLLLFQLKNWDVNQGLQVAPPETPEREPRWVFLRPLARLFDRYAQAIRDRVNLSEPLVNYLNYAWAAFHAVFITGWLTLVFFCVNDNQSVMDNVSAWYILPPAVLLLCGGLFTYAYLSRVPFRPWR